MTDFRKWVADSIYPFWIEEVNKKNYLVYYRDFTNAYLRRFRLNKVTDYMVSALKNNESTKTKQGWVKIIDFSSDLGFN